MTSLRRILIAAALAASCAVQASDRFSNDVSDLWWNPNESGWGVNFMQQSNIAFATFFVYDANGQAHWYVASDLEAASVPTDQRYRFSGRLYETTGPAFSAASFAASAVTRRDVGSVIFEFFPPDNGHVTYTVDGLTVDKAIQRQTWSTPDLTGRYYGGTFTAKSPFPSAASCTVKAGLQVFDDIAITQSGSSVMITATSGTPAQELCRYTGTLTQAGHMSRVAGAYSCQSGPNGAFALDELEAGVTGLSARYSATLSDCAALEPVFGNLAAIRKQ